MIFGADWCSHVLSVGWLTQFDLFSEPLRCVEVCLGCAVGIFASQCMVWCAVHGAFPDGCRWGICRWTHRLTNDLPETHRRWTSLEEMLWQFGIPWNSFAMAFCAWRRQQNIARYDMIRQHTITHDWSPEATSPNILFKSAGLCPRLAQTRGRPCADTSKPQDLCDAERASHLLPKTLDVDEAVLETSQGLVRGCAQNRGPGFSIFLLASFNPQGRRCQQSSELTEQTLAPLVLPSSNQIWSDHVRSSPYDTFIC